jgi:ABC-type amino acid transport system permease subunit
MGLPIKNNPAELTRKKFRAALLVQLLIGLFLAGLTIGVLDVVHDAGNSQLLGWLSLSDVGVVSGVSVFVLMLIVFGMDALWVVYMILWLLKRKLHIKNTDNTLHLP